MNSPDFLILGLGPAGCAAAIFAARRGASVMLAGLTGTGLRFGEHLPAEANPLLQELGVQPDSVTCAGVASWWNGVESAQDALFHPLGEGKFVSRPAFEESLRWKARELGVTIREGYTVGARDPMMVTLQGPDPLSLRPQKIIDATGRSAAVARQFGARRERVDRLTAVGTRVRSTHPDRRLLVEAVHGGWWYTCPLPGEQRSFVFLTDSDLPQFEVARKPPGWLQLMGPRMKDVFPSDFAHVKLAIAPADSANLSPTSGEGWVAIGDAAVSFDPLASRGLCHALSSAREAVHGDSPRRGGFEDYLEAKVRCYQLEERFEGEVFWERRR